MAPPSFDFTLPSQHRHEKEISPLSKGFAIFLAVVAGFIGAHDFYLGYRKKGMTKVVLFALMITAPINSVWAVIDVINMLVKRDFCDGQNRLLK